MKLAIAIFSSTLVLASAGFTFDAHACGGCFVAPSENTVVTGHRMAVSISLTQSVLWDQIEYAGAPEEFSWVLPVKKGARLELANDAWFEALDAATTTRVTAPFVSCPSSGFGCGGFASAEFDAAAPKSTADGGSSVTVLHQGTVGPYETVTLATEVPGALETWLDQHGYSVPTEIEPVLDAYVTEGFDFIALRLIPGVGVQQMKPVRVVTPGAGFTLPLRMVAAGTGAQTALKLFIIGEGRYAAQNFGNAIVPEAELSWNFTTSASNYSKLRGRELAKDDGRTFLTTYAVLRALLSEQYDSVTGFPVSYQVGEPADGLASPTIAGAYFNQALANGDAPEGGASPAACANLAAAQAYATGLVVDTCDEQGACAAPLSGEIAASAFACAQLDDLAVAMTGMHPADVWVTRLEADLPRAALASDLLLEASMSQATQSSSLLAPNHVNHPCDEGQEDVAWATLLAPPRSRGTGSGPLGGVVAVGLGLGWLALRARRRSSREPST
ncbi:MAG: DUF2330 domain-containing protein [Myxococcales bacterium]|nr:DUF2330 domain-containing protein [Myxococcales bacterium]